MTATCPQCRRPVVTREEWEAMPPGDIDDPVRCYRDVAADGMCSALADAALLADARALPAGVLARVAAVLRAGGERYGVAPHETGGNQSFDDHIRHALDHVYGAAQDADGDPHLLHAIARLVLAYGAQTESNQ